MAKKPPYESRPISPLTEGESLALELILSPRPSLEETLKERALRDFEAADPQGQRSLIVDLASRLGCQAEQWTWETLIAISGKRDLPSLVLKTLRSVFLFRVALGKLRNPAESRGKGRPKKDPFPALAVAGSVNALRIHGRSTREASFLVARYLESRGLRGKERVFAETVRSTWKKARRNGDFPL